MCALSDFPGPKSPVPRSRAKLFWRWPCQNSPKMLLFWRWPCQKSADLALARAKAPCQTVLALGTLVCKTLLLEHHGLRERILWGRESRKWRQLQGLSTWHIIFSMLLFWRWIAVLALNCCFGAEQESSAKVLAMGSLWGQPGRPAGWPAPGRAGPGAGKSLKVHSFSGQPKQPHGSERRGSPTRLPFGVFARPPLRGSSKQNKQQKQQVTPNVSCCFQIGNFGKAVASFWWCSIGIIYRECEIWIIGTNEFRTV